MIKTQDQLITFVDNGFDVSLPADQVLFADELMKSEVRKADVERALHRALDNQSFKVYYQPIYDTEEGKIRSCEALVRMIDDELGFVSPEEFIKVAEQTGLVSQIGEIVFEKVYPPHRARVTAGILLSQRLFNHVVKNHDTGA